MKIILLSGGSGKRLWPLSNDVRSKQFIKLFKNDEGDYDSMVQRVYRQIKQKVGAEVVIATSKTQVSSIKNQLGKNVSVCVEPCRRDTFPAIALACAFLKDEQKVQDDECIVVCPVDPYVDETFFKTFIDLEKQVNSGESNLVLMGIEPTYPSEKYGYIIPETQDTVSSVKCFKEKPSAEVATEYIKQNALWNAGVFAFKLGYIMKKAHELLDFDDYRDLYKKFEKQKKISFDYAVVENEKNIKVVRYNGAWKDVGTWNAITEIMTEKTKGNVVLDDLCDNTHIINELNIPIVGMGLKDIVVTASGDGILVAKKERCDYLKPIVEQLPNEIRVAEKSWGTYQVLDVQTHSMTVRIMLKQGCSMTYHHHEFRDEVWTIVSGQGQVVVDGIIQDVKAGDVVTINAGCNHSIKALTDLSLIEVQIGDNIDALDKIKQEINI